MNYQNEIVEDKKEKRYLFILLVLTLFFGVSVIVGFMGLLGMMILVTTGPENSIFSTEPMILFTLCSCTIYPISTSFGIGFSWYAFTKKRYGIIPILILIPFINLVIVLTANFFI
jgi:hypothetical protein